MRLTISCYFLYYFRFHRKKYMLAADTEASHSVVHSARHWGKMTPDTAVDSRCKIADRMAACWYYTAAYCNIAADFLYEFVADNTAVAADTANTGLHYYIDYLARQSLRLYCAEQTVQKE